MLLCRNNARIHTHTHAHAHATHTRIFTIHTYNVRMNVRRTSHIIYILLMYTCIRTRICHPYAHILSTLYIYVLKSTGLWNYSCLVYSIHCVLVLVSVAYTAKIGYYIIIISHRTCRKRNVRKGNAMYVRRCYYK